MRSEQVEYLKALGVSEAVASRVADNSAYAGMMPHSYARLDEQPTEEILVKTPTGYVLQRQPRHNHPRFVWRCTGCGLSRSEVIGSDWDIPCLGFQYRDINPKE